MQLNNSAKEKPLWIINSLINCIELEEAADAELQQDSLILYSHNNYIIANGIPSNIDPVSIVNYSSYFRIDCKFGDNVILENTHILYSQMSARTIILNENIVNPFVCWKYPFISKIISPIIQQVETLRYNIATIDNFRRDIFLILAKATSYYRLAKNIEVYRSIEHKNLYVYDMGKTSSGSQNDYVGTNNLHREINYKYLTGLSCTLRKI